MPAREYDNKESFILFPNTRMRADKRDPEWTGTLYDGDGNEFWMSMWEKSGPKGEFFTGSFRKKEARPEDRPAARPAPARAGHRRSVANDDDVP